MFADDLAGIGVDRQVNSAMVGRDSNSEDRPAHRPGVKHPSATRSDLHGAVDAVVALLATAALIVVAIAPAIAVTVIVTIIAVLAVAIVVIIVATAVMLAPALIESLRNLDDPR